jgi:hypothetical protein
MFLVWVGTRQSLRRFRGQKVAAARMLFTDPLIHTVDKAAAGPTTWSTYLDPPSTSLILGHACEFNFSTEGFHLLQDACYMLKSEATRLTQVFIYPCGVSPCSQFPLFIAIFWLACPLNFKLQDQKSLTLYCLTSSHNCVRSNPTNNPYINMYMCTYMCVDSSASSALTETWLYNPTLLMNFLYFS